MSYRQFYEVFDKEQDRYQCLICEKVYKGQGNIIQHIKRNHPEVNDEAKHSDSFTTHDYQFTYKGTRIDEKIVNILVWRAKQGVSIRAIKSSLFENFTNIKLPCEKVLQEMSYEISQKILLMHYNRLRNTYFSITIDGGTVIHMKWVAIGALYASGSQIEYDILDVWAVERRLTANYLKEKIMEFKQMMAENFKAVLIGVCSDNGSNFVKTFGPQYIDQLQLFRFACGCHTIQLGINDFLQAFPVFKELKKALKKVSNRLSKRGKSFLEEHGITGYPKYQKQRWNSWYLAIDYVLQNEKVFNFMENDEKAACKIETLLALHPLLKLCHDFTVAIEGDSINLSVLYIEYNKLIEKLQENENEYSEKLIELIEARFHSTANIGHAKLVYYCTEIGIADFQSEFEAATIIPQSNHEAERNRLELLEKKASLLDELHQYLAEINDIWSPDPPSLFVVNGIQPLNIFECFDSMLNNLVIEDPSPYKFPSHDQLVPLIRHRTSLRIFFEFLQKIQTIPASEAQSERIFAKMRDILNLKMTRMKPETFHTQLILATYAKEISLKLKHNAQEEEEYLEEEETEIEP